MPTSTPKRISGRDNPEFKRFLAVKAKKNRDLVLVEGPKMIDEAIRSKLLLDTLAFNEDIISISETLHEEFRPVFFTSALVKAISEVETNQGMVALFERPVFDASWLKAATAFVLILDGVQDPGNVGTLIRTAEATGVSGVLLTQGCADPFSPKALRASAGSAFRIPHVSGLSAEGLLDLLPPSMTLVTTSVDPRSPSLFDAAVNLPMALALGSEGSGLDGRIEAGARRKVRVPQARPVESLNVAAAGAVVLFEIARRAGILTN